MQNTAKFDRFSLFLKQLSQLAQLKCKRQGK